MGVNRGSRGFNSGVLYRCSALASSGLTRRDLHSELVTCLRGSIKAFLFPRLPFLLHRETHIRGPGIPNAILNSEHT